MKKTSRIIAVLFSLFAAIAPAHAGTTKQHMLPLTTVQAGESKAAAGPQSMRPAPQQYISCEERCARRWGFGTPAFGRCVATNC